MKALILLCVVALIGCSHTKEKEVEVEFDVVVHYRNGDADTVTGVTNITHEFDWMRVTNSNWRSYGYTTIGKYPRETVSGISKIERTEEE